MYSLPSLVTRGPIQLLLHFFIHHKLHIRILNSRSARLQYPVLTIIIPRCIILQRLIRPSSINIHIRLTHAFRSQAYSVEVSIVFQLHERVKLASGTIWTTKGMETKVGASTLLFAAFSCAFVAENSRGDVLEKDTKCWEGAAHNEKVGFNDAVWVSWVTWKKIEDLHPKATFCQWPTLVGVWQTRQQQNQSDNGRDECDGTDSEETDETKLLTSRHL